MQSRRLLLRPDDRSDIAPSATRASTFAGNGAPLINPSVACQGEMWTMLMQMIPSADAIGQSGLDASSTMGARAFVTPVAFTHAATLSRASGSGSEG
jgi:hypothetical protein